MAIVLTSTTEPQANLDHAVSEEYRDPAALDQFKLKSEAAEEKPNTEEAKVEEGETAPDTQRVDETPGESDKGTEEKPRKNPSAKEQARINELTKRWNHEKTEKEAYRKKLEEVEAAKKPPEILFPGEPQWDGRQENWHPFLARHHAWANDQMRQQKEVQERTRLIDEFKVKSIAFGEEHPDFEQLLARENDETIPPLAYKALLKKGNSHEIVYHLLKTPDDLHALQEMDEEDAIEAIGEISRNLQETKKVPPEPKPKIKPPEPLVPVGASSTKSGQTIWDLPLRELIKARNKQERENKRF